MLENIFSFLAGNTSYAALFVALFILTLYENWVRSQQNLPYGLTFDISSASSLVKKICKQDSVIAADGRIFIE